MDLVNCLNLATISAPVREELPGEYRERAKIFKDATHIAVEEFADADLADFCFTKIIALNRTRGELIVEMRDRVSGGDISEDPEIYQAAFQYKYDDSQQLVGRFHSHLETCLSGWENTKYYAPYCSLVQSSGTGKTRLLKQLAVDKKAYVAYICLRKAGDSGYPLRSPDITNVFLTARRYDVYSSYIAAVLEYLNESPDLSPQDYLALCENGSSDYWNVIDDKMKRLDFKNAKEVSIITTLRDKLETFVAQPRSEELGKLKIVFAFDEAMHLVQAGIDSKTEKSPFYYLRQALRLLPRTNEEACVFAVMTDTSTRVCTFSPECRFDTSFRTAKRASIYFLRFTSLGLTFFKGQARFRQSKTSLRLGISRDMADHCGSRHLK